MNDELLSAGGLLIWHDWVHALAVLLLGGLLAFALLQVAASGAQSPLARRLPRPSLRQGLTIGLVLVGTVPVAALSILLSERSAHLRTQRMADRLDQTATTLAHSIDRYLDKNLAGVASAASSISAGGNFDAESLTRGLLIYHAVFDDFLTMLGTDVDGNILAATSFNSVELAPVSLLTGFNVADRTYFEQPMANGQPFVSRVFRGRSLGRDPIVAISAVLADANGNHVGVVEGSLNLRAFEEIDRERPQIDGANMILVDEDSRVVYSSRDAGLEELDNIAADPLIVNGSLSQPASAYAYHTGNDGDQQQFLAVYAITDLGWRVFLRVPANQVSQQILADYQVAAYLLGIAVVISLLLAFALVRRVSHSVSDMNAAISRFSVDGSGEMVRTPANTPREFRPVFAHMRERSRDLRRARRRLHNSIDAGEQLRRDLTQAVALRDVEIAERTADLEAANEQLNDLSRTDALTGIPNRRRFDSFRQRIWRLGARDQVPVAAILMDIDYFKIYNDTCGHQQGDECLREVARALFSCASRPLDLVARYGGEEFVGLLSNTQRDEALLVAERMRAAVAALEIPHPGSPHETVTISAGIAAVIPAADRDACADSDSDSNSDGDSLLRAADEALYYAKAAGRNCVVFRQGKDYLTYDAGKLDLTETNVIRILAGKRQG